MNLSAADIAKLSAWLAATGLAELELRGPGVHCRLRQDGGTVAPIVTPLDVAATLVSSPSVGVFLTTHPLHDAPLAPAGVIIEAGQPVGLLRIGSLLLPVPAPTRAIAGAVLAEPDRPVGYGAPLIEIHPTAE